MLTDHHIAALCDVARSAGTDLSRDGQGLLTDLLALGYVAPDEKAGATQPRYRLTPAGQAVLDERGVGANES